MMAFKLTQSGKESGDCTAPYKVSFDKHCTVGEFVSLVLGRGEWGYIGINQAGSIFGYPCCQYRGTRLTTDPLPDEYLNSPIDIVTASGGWRRMDYRITVKEQS